MGIARVGRSDAATVVALAARAAAALADQPGRAPVIQRKVMEKTSRKGNRWFFSDLDPDPGNPKLFPTMEEAAAWDRELAARRVPTPLPSPKPSSSAEKPTASAVPWSSVVKTGTSSPPPTLGPGSSGKAPVPTLAPTKTPAPTLAPTKTPAPTLAPTKAITPSASSSAAPVITSPSAKAPTPSKVVKGADSPPPKASSAPIETASTPKGTSGKPLSSGGSTTMTFAAVVGSGKVTAEAEALPKAAPVKEAPTWEEVWRAKQREVVTVLSPFVARFRKLDPLCTLRIRGSLAYGFKSLHLAKKSGGELASFDPTSFDVDAYLISDTLFLEAAKGNPATIADGQLPGSYHPTISKLLWEVRAALAEVRGNRDAVDTYAFNILLRSRENAEDVEAFDARMIDFMGYDDRYLEVDGGTKK